MDSTSRLDTCRRGDHVIQVYSTDEERVGVVEEILDWIRDGEVFIFLSVLSEIEVMALCPRSLAGKIRDAINSGKMVLMDSYSFYCDGNEFNSREMSKRWEEIKTEYLSKGFTGMFVLGDLSWCGGNQELFSRVMEYETLMVTRALPKGMTSICQYDSRLYRSQELEDLISIHELRIEGNEIERNYWLISHYQQ